MFSSATLSDELYLERDLHFRYDFFLRLFTKECVIQYELTHLIDICRFDQNALLCPQKANDARNRNRPDVRNRCVTVYLRIAIQLYDVITVQSQVKQRGCWSKLNKRGKFDQSPGAGQDLHGPQSRTRYRECACTE